MRKVFEKAKWIAADRVARKETGYVSPAVQLRRQFDLQAKNGKYTCRICGLGYYVLYINGKKVGDDVLSPAFTVYDKRAQYMEYDVTDFLQEGANVVAIRVGDGFYNQTTYDVWSHAQATWRDSAKAIFEIVTNKEEVVLQSDATWRVSTEGPTVHNALRTGEYYDARKEDGWLEVGYDDGAWKPVFVGNPAGGKMEKMQIPPIRECETLQPVKIWKSEKGWIFDFGKNMAGYAEICMQGKNGQTVELHYSERVENNELWKENDLIGTQFPYQVDKYTFKGEGVETWKPQFVYHGFQYVEVIGLENEPTMSALKAHFAHTDLKIKGDFSTDHTLMQWIYDAGVRSYLSNVHSFIEDCPHREKNGWTGDSAISCDYAVYLWEMKKLYKKCLNDLIDTQRDNGQLPCVAPTGGWGYNWGNGPAWDCALFFLPYSFYKETGDNSLMMQVYSAGKKYLDYAKYHRENGLVCYGLADWLFTDATRFLCTRMANELSDSCYYYQMQKIMALICQMKGKTAEAEVYAQEAEATRLGILDKYVDGDSVDNNGQGALAIVLYFDIVRGEQAKKIAAKLVAKLKEDNYVFGVGILGMKALLNALSQYGYTDVAFRTIDRYDFPSYGDWKNQGATTLWEAFNGGASRNHHMYADVLHWMIRNIAGLQNAGIAYDSVILKPYFYAEDCACETSTRNGEIAFKWKKKANVFHAEIRLPKGAKAKLILPNCEEIEIQGTHAVKTIRLQ